MYAKNLFVFLFVFFYALTGWGQNPSWADDITILSPITCGNNCYEFVATNIPPNNSSGTERGYFYTWFFGDGTMKHEGFSLNSTQIFSGPHDFIFDGALDVTLQLTPAYTDKDNPELLQVPSGSTTTGTSNQPQTGAIRELSIIPTLNPKAGDVVYYIISYGNTCQDIGGNAVLGPLTFSVGDPTQVEILDMQYNNEAEILSNTPGARREFFIQPVQPNTKRQVFAKLAFSNTLKEGDPVKFFASWDWTADGSPSCFDILNISTFRDSITLSTVKSHDPNKIFANQDSICPLPTVDSLIYTIVFQNVGAGSAQQVIVRNTIPEPFNPNSINVLDPKGLISNIDVINREVEWILSSTNGFLKTNLNQKKLRGTGEPDYVNQKIPEDDTIDSIIFSIKFNTGVVLPPCSAIANRAEVIFDNNPSISTNDYFTKVNCNNCSTCNASLTQFSTPIIEYDGQNPVPLILPVQHYDTIIWYPLKGLNGIGTARLTASPSKHMTYTAMVISGCSQQLFRVPVHIRESETNIGVGLRDAIISKIWWCCLIGALLSFILLICFLHFMRKLIRQQKFKPNQERHKY